MDLMKQRYEELIDKQKTTQFDSLYDENVMEDDPPVKRAMPISPAHAQVCPSFSKSG